jgi:outer membrane immunogenic protein
MKKVVFFTVLILFTTTMYAQNQLNVGVGLSDNSVPVFVGFDHSVSRDVTLGMELSYRDYSDSWNNVDYNHDVWGISGNANYHFNSVLNIPRNWDFYAGLNLGAYIWSSNDNYHGDHSTGLGLGAQIGGRYYFNNKVAMNLEFGGGNEFSGGKIGLTIKL